MERNQEQEFHNKVFEFRKSFEEFLKTFENDYKGQFPLKIAHYIHGNKLIARIKVDIGKDIKELE